MGEISPDMKSATKGVPPEQFKLLLSHQPVLARTGKLQLTFRRTGNWKLYALGIDGRRRDEIAVETSPEGIRIDIDTDKLANGPTPFFELVDASSK